MNMIHTHFQACQSFTIDTESVRHPSNLALIQIQPLSVELPYYVLLVQLRHLAGKNSVLFGKIKLLFTTIFDKFKTIYSWGALSRELEYTTQYSPFSEHTQVQAIDLQLKFGEWYRSTPTFCEKCRSNKNTIITIDLSVFCRCKEHPYHNPSNRWSLQNAVVYATTRFLDKSQTENNWFTMLDSKYSRLSSADCASMLNPLRTNGTNSSHFLKI